MKRIISITAVVAIALGAGGVLAWQWQSNLAASAYHSPSNFQETAQAAKSTTTAASKTAPQPYDCGVSGCNQTTGHKHSACPVSGCGQVTNHKHNGTIYYGHRNDDGHSHAGHRTQKNSGHGARHGEDHH